MTQGRPGDFNFSTPRKQAGNMGGSVSGRPHKVLLCYSLLLIVVSVRVIIVVVCSFLIASSYSVVHVPDLGLPFC